MRFVNAALSRAVALLMSFIVTSCGLAACTSAQPSAHDPMLRLPLYGRVASLDPARAGGGSSSFVDSLLYSGLVKFGPDMHVVPDLAVSIPTVSTDGRTYTFTVRQDARFNDGRHCTASDVAYSLARALLPQTHGRLARRYLGNIVGARAVENGETTALEGVTVVHRLTIRIHLNHPDATFLQKLASPVAFVVDRRVMGAKHASRHVPAAAGTGAWVVSERDRAGALVLSPRHHYYDGPLRLDSLSLIPVASDTSAISMYKKGKLDAARVPAAQVAAVANRPDFQQSNALEAYYAIPVAEGRRLATHIDRTKLLRRLTPALSPLDTIVPPAVPDYVSSAPSIDPPQSARSFRRLEFALRPVGKPGWSSSMLSNALREQWRLVRANGTSIYLVHVAEALPDPGQWLQLVLGSTRSARYRRPLRSASYLTNDPVSRMDLYSSAERSALARGLVVPLASANLSYLIRDRVQGLEVTPLGLMPANDTWSSVGLT